MKTVLPMCILTLSLSMLTAAADKEKDKLWRRPRSVGKPLKVSSLPKHIVAKDGQLTLFADFKDVRGEMIVLYLINKKKESVQFDAQDGDIYVKLQFKAADGAWVRAQPHRYSWCGNSYFVSPKLMPGHYFKFLGHYPSKGVPGAVRYHRYAGNLDLTSNVGTGRADAADIKTASTDRMAISTGTFGFVSRIATGDLQIGKSKLELRNSRDLAIGVLAHERFSKEDVVSVLERIVKADDKELAKTARWIMEHIEKRKRDRDRAISLATAHAKKQDWQKRYVLTTPADVEEFSAYWKISFGGRSDRPALSAFGVVRVDKKSGQVTVIPQK